MARFYIDEVFTLGLSSAHTSTDWIVYTDETKTKELFRSFDNTVWLTEISATLIDPDTGELYVPENGTYALARVNYNGAKSKWFVATQCDWRGDTNRIGEPK